MTSPEPEDPAEGTPPPGQPQSPQAVAMDEAMAQAESSLMPVIAGLIAAEVAMSSIPSTPDFVLPGPYRAARWGAKALYTVLRSGEGVEKIIRGAIQLLLIPLGMVGWRSLADHAALPSSPPAATPAGMTGAINDAVDRAITKVSESVQYVLDKDDWSDDDIYSMFGDPKPRFRPGKTGETDTDVDPRSATQRAVDNFARQMSRWLTRETVFSLQETIAGGMGFTHKRWITMHDHKVRDFHRVLHGRAVPVGERFMTPVGGLRYPGDTTAPIELWINCRCVIEWIAR